MKLDRSRSNMYGAADVAEFCDVDLKTVHNWVAKGHLPAFRTEGRHLRFLRVDLYDFLREHSYPVPDSLRCGRPSIALVEDDGVASVDIRAAFDTEFDLHTFADPIDALVSLVTLGVEGLVLGHVADRFDALHAVERLRASPLTRHVRTFAFVARPNESDWRRAGVRAVVHRPDIDTLRAVVIRMLGVDLGVRPPSRAKGPRRRGAPSALRGTREPR